MSQTPDIHALLEGVRAGTVSVTEAEGVLRRKPFEDLGYARLDTHRQLRSGFPEVVFCQGKADAHLVRIFETLWQANGAVLGTRATAEQFEQVKKVLPNADYDPVSRTIRCESEQKPRRGRIVVCTAGTADLPVAEEAARTAEFFGRNVERLYDVGVSGLHRLLARLETLQSARCIVVAAGMEGALASVVGGLVACPVVAVPTSVGYGASFGGLSALLTMLNSCANGVAVVNIDNGYGAGYLAAQIDKMGENEP